MKVELIQNSAISFSVVLNNKYGGLDKLLDELKETFKVSVDKEVLAAKALSLMNSKRITSLCVHQGKSKNRTIGIIHIHNILENNIQ